MCPLLSIACQVVCKANPLPGQQAVVADVGEQGGVEDGSSATRSHPETSGSLGEEEEEKGA